MVSKWVHKGNLQPAPVMHSSKGRFDGTDCGVTLFYKPAYRPSISMDTTRSQLHREMGPIDKAETAQIWWASLIRTQNEKMEEKNHVFQQPKAG